MTIKRKAKRKAVTVKRKAKRKVVTIKRNARRKVAATRRNAKRKAVTEGESIPTRRESLSLRRIPTLADADEFVRRDEERKTYVRKQQLKQARAHAAWRASDEYKALAKRWATPTAAVRKPKNPSKPENPTEARAWLSTIAGHVGESLQAYRAHKLSLPVEDHGVEAYAAERMQRDQWLSDVRRIWWFVSTVKAYLSGGNNRSLGRLLGLERAPGRPAGQKPGKLSDWDRETAAQRATKSEKRKTRQGEAALKSWKEVALDLGKTPQAVRRRVQRAAPKLAEDKAREIAAALKQRLEQKPPPVGRAIAHSAARGKEIHAHNRRKR
jgi:hypothetical protein